MSPGWRRSARLLLAFILGLVILSAGCQPSTPTPAYPPAETSASELLDAAVLATAIPEAGPTPQPASAINPIPPVTISPISPHAPNPTPGVTLRPQPSPTAVPPVFSGATAWEHVQALAAEIGSRPSNSPPLHQAAQYILGKLSFMGYSARLQPYTFNFFQERSVRLLVKQPESLEIVAKAMVYTGSGSVEAELANCGTGQPQEFPSTSMGGKAALLQRGIISFQEKVTNAVARGASAAIVFNDRSGEFHGTLTRQAPIPVVGILQQDGQRLQEYARRGATSISLDVDAITDARQGSNVVASWRETSRRPKVVVGAHYDSVTGGPGANDNGSGVAVMLELARATRAQPYPFDLVFVAFGDEEVGLVGSKRYLESLPADQRGQILAMINLDMVGVGEKMEFGGQQDLVIRAILIAQQMGYPASEVEPSLRSSSDHTTFLEAGIPSVFFYRSEDPNYHTKLDTAEKVTDSNLEAAGKVALRLLDAIAVRR